MSVSILTYDYDTFLCNACIFVYHYLLVVHYRVLASCLQISDYISTWCALVGSCVLLADIRLYMYTHCVPDRGYGSSQTQHYITHLLYVYIQIVYNANKWHAGIASTHQHMGIQIVPPRMHAYATCA